MTENHAGERAYEPFSSNFFNSLVGGLTKASGSPWLVAAALDDQLTKDGTQPVFIKLTLDGSLQGELDLEFRRSEAAMLVSKFLRQPIDEFGTEQADALLNVVQAGLSETCLGLAEGYGRFTIKASENPEPALDRVQVAQITAADDEGNRASILMYLSPALSEAVRLSSQSGSAVPGSGKSTTSVAGTAMSEQKNLDLVMDVELNVTLRFGQRQLTLREVLELTSGSVVELDRQVDEPVELLLDGKVIARGEAVVIDGNYGLRVTEVSQRISAQGLC
jgi:flagellar motor switch protein FliN